MISKIEYDKSSYIFPVESVSKQSPLLQKQEKSGAKTTSMLFSNN